MKYKEPTPEELKALREGIGPEPRPTTDNFEEQAAYALRHLRLVEQSLRRELVLPAQEQAFKNTFGKGVREMLKDVQDEIEQVEAGLRQYAGAPKEKKRGWVNRETVVADLAEKYGCKTGETVPGEVKAKMREDLRGKGIAITDAVLRVYLQHTGYTKERLLYGDDKRE